MTAASRAPLTASKYDRVENRSLLLTPLAALSNVIAIVVIVPPT